MSFAENLEDGVTLSLSAVEAGAEALHFTYTVVNGTTATIYLVNRLFHRRGAAGFQVDPDLVYVAVGEDTVLHIRKQFIRVPSGLRVEVPETPYVTPLAAGESFSETLSLALPLAPHDPYRPQARADRPYDAAGFVFTLGYLVAEQPIPAKQVTLPSGVQEWQIYHGEIARLQRLKVSAPVRAAIATVAMRQG